MTSSPIAPQAFDQQLLEVFFDQSPLAAALFDRDCRLQRSNAKWAEAFTRSLGVPASRVAAGESIFDVLPGVAEHMTPLIEPVLRGQPTRQLAHRVSNEDAVFYWDVLLSPFFAGDVVTGFVIMAVDATERVTAYELLRERIETFAGVASSMTVDQPIEVTLRALARTARDTAGAEACAVIVVDPDRGLLTVFEADGLPDEYGPALAESLRRGVRSPTREALERQELTEVRDARERGLANPLYEPIHPYLRAATWDDMVVVPLDSRGRSLGVMQYYHRAGRAHDDDEKSFLTALADQAAVAVANAALYAKSERDAALVERQRLARDLHDSVSQALFSMTLHARTAERQLAAAGVSSDAPPAQSVRRLAELTQGALAEMRALIFELRPGALAEEGLVTALTRQAAALAAREGVPVEVAGPAVRPALDPGVEEHLYRLALEALNNAVKHAKASRIRLRIALDDDALTLSVSDDGVGFDPSDPTPGHLGRTTMAERAAAIGGSLRIESALGAGCVVTATVEI